MKITVVGNRGGQRAIHWPGAAFLAMSVVVIAGGTATLVYYLVSGAPPPWPRLLVTVAIGIGGTLAGAFGHGLRTPIEKLSKLN